MKANKKTLMAVKKFLDEEQEFELSGKRLTEARNALHLSINYMAKYLEFTEEYLDEIERGSVKVNASSLGSEFLDKLSTLFGVEASEFFIDTFATNDEREIESLKNFREMIIGNIK